MDFRPSALQRELARGTRAVLERHCPPGVVRSAWETPAVADDVWSALVELGLPGALLPEAAGGLDLTVPDLLAAIVETGRAAVPAPVVETAFVSLPLLVATARDELVKAVVTGRAVVTAAAVGDPVPWISVATHALLVTDGAVYVAPRDALRTEPLPAVDGSRPLVRVAPPDGNPVTDDPALVRGIRARASVGAAAQLIGLAARQLEMTVAYVADRHQFGAPIGSVQAVQHKLADALLGVRFAEPTVRAAGLALEADPRLERTQTAATVAMAKALASDAADLVARTAIQCHGSMGYTDEYDLQLYAKRTWALAAAWGTAADHRAAYGNALGIPRPVVPITSEEGTR